MFIPTIMGRACSVSVHAYETNNRIAVRLADLETYEPVLSMTINVKEVDLVDREVILTREASHHVSALIQANIIEMPHDTAESGMATYHVAKLTEAFLAARQEPQKPSLTRVHLYATVRTSTVVKETDPQRAYEIAKHQVDLPKLLNGKDFEYSDEITGGLVDTHDQFGNRIGDGFAIDEDPSIKANREFVEMVARFTEDHGDNPEDSVSAINSLRERALRLTATS